MMEDFTAIQSSVQTSLVATTRGVSRLAAEDLQFHRSLEPTIGTQLDAQHARLLSLAQRLLGSATTNTEAVGPSLKDIDDVEGNWTKVVDVIDSLLERADTALDEFTGAVKRLTPREMTPNAKPNPHSHKLAAAFRNQDIDKPQLLFEDKTDNYPRGPFRPLLTTKPHSATPLQVEAEVLDETNEPGFSHPYQHEIEQFTYPSSIYTSAEPILYSSFEETAATLVDTEEALDVMIEELKAAKEIAVDLEHHDQRSYIGIVSLMQISTRNHDWIIDTLKPWRRKLSRLNEVFADPSIIKVLHGAHMDIMWLQRDLGVYIVGLFDTYSAARSLGYPQASYAFLLKTFTGVDAQKQFQMADWRIRPLPQELLDYARSDTHYLLYVYDNMRNELLEKSKLSSSNHNKDRIWDVQERSKETALQRYEHPTYDPDYGQGGIGWFKMLSRTPASFTKEQFSVFRAVHQWRDNVAREQDDSVHYVMPQHIVFTIAKLMPATKADLFKAAQPVTRTIKLRVDELVAVIAQAKEIAEDAPNMIDVLNRFDPGVARKGASIPLPAQPSTQFTGVSSFLQRASDRLGASVSSSLPLRSTTSLFWGTSMSQIDKKQQRPLSTEVHISVPLPPLTNGIFAEPEEPVTMRARTPQAVEAQEVSIHEDDEVFILKERNRKRKLPDVQDEDDGMRIQADEVALPDEAEERARLKAEKRRAKKEAKRAARASVDGLASDTHADVVPFDYASAPSVLSQPVQDRKGKKGKKPFDPYQKSLQAPKGLPRVQKESAGRSMTYAS